jgi:thymidylate kinase
MPQNARTQVLVLTGTIGAGKTTLAEATSTRIHQAGLRHALIDLDWLGQLYPPPAGTPPFDLGLAFTNLAAIWPNFRAAGARYGIVAGTIVTRLEADELRRVLSDADLTFGLVTSPPELVKQRIRDRDRGAVLEDFLSRTDALASTIKAATMHDFEVVNDTTAPDQAALDVLKQLDWLP